MLLASFYVNSQDSLRADFQQYYNLNLDYLGREYGINHAASLALELPDTSRIKKKLKPEIEWTKEDVLLSGIEYWTHLLVWSKTKDGSRGLNKPKPINPFVPKKTERIGTAVSREKLFEIYGH